MSKMTTEPATSESLTEPADDTKPTEHRHRGRRLLIVGAAGAMMIAAVWTIATVRTGLANSKSRRRNRNRKHRH